MGLDFKGIEGLKQLSSGWAMAALVGFVRG